MPFIVSVAIEPNQVMLEREEETVLSGRVEVDDAYMGGERHGGKRGRGAESKLRHFRKTSVPQRPDRSGELAWRSFPCQSR
jgi:hypothetical protein